LSLVKDAAAALNRFFDQFQFPIKIKKMFFYRPAYFDSYFEHFEPIFNVERLFECNSIFVNLEAKINGRDSEFDIRYNNENKRLILKKCSLKYCDFEEGENLEQIRTHLTTLMQAITTIILPGTLNVILKNK